jgi:hypothetical protein
MAVAQVGVASTSLSKALITLPASVEVRRFDRLSIHMKQVTSLKTIRIKLSLM